MNFAPAKETVQGKFVNLPKLGRIHFRQSRSISDGFAIKQAQVVKQASGYYVILVLQADVEVPEVQPHGQALGIDVGLEHFLATSDGELVENPRFFVTGQRKLKSLQRRLKQKTKGSNRWLQQQQKVARNRWASVEARIPALKGGQYP